MTEQKLRTLDLLAQIDAALEGVPDAELEASSVLDASTDYQRGWDTYVGVTHKDWYDDEIAAFGIAEKDGARLTAESYARLFAAAPRLLREVRAALARKGGE